MDFYSFRYYYGLFAAVAIVCALVYLIINRKSLPPNPELSQQRPARLSFKLAVVSCAPLVLFFPYVLFPTLLFGEINGVLLTPEYKRLLIPYLIILFVLISREVWESSGNRLAMCLGFGLLGFGNFHSGIPLLSYLIVRAPVELTTTVTDIQFHVRRSRCASEIRTEYDSILNSVICVNPTQGERLSIGDKVVLTGTRNALAVFVTRVIPQSNPH